jgi:hypothetical protein
VIVAGGALTTYPAAHPEAFEADAKVTGDMGSADGATRPRGAATDRHDPLVMDPGGHRFGDFWRLGLPLLVLFGVVAVLLVPVFWPF